DARDGHARLARGGRGVAATPDKTRDAGCDHRADRRDIAMLDGGERRLLRAAVGRVDQHDVGGLVGSDEAAIEAVYFRVVAGRRADELLRWHVGETRQMRD